MAVWGTPVTSEGDAERCVRAALDVVEAVEVLGTDAGMPGLTARAGVVTGEVAVTLGATGEGMVAGDPVNTAARIQSTARPGTVWVDDTTHRLAVPGVAFEDAGVHELKGRSEPSRLWLATRVMSGVGGAQRVDGLEAPLTGRDAELRTIKELFHATAERRSPRLVLVSGPAGVGKSRLGWEFEKYVDGLADTMWWHRGRCLSYGEGVVFWALAEIVRQRLGIAEEDSAAVAVRKLGDGLGAVVPDEAERAYVGPRLARLLGVQLSDDLGATLPREELFAGWRLFFERLADTAPVLLLVEDAEHADAGLLDFLDHLVDWARESRIFVLVFARPELALSRSGFGVGRNRSSLTLDPLDPASMGQLVDALVPDMPPEARASITAQAEGIPLFAIETVRSLIDRDVVVPHEGVYRLVGEVGSLSVPAGLHGLLAARLDALEPGLRGLVADAAVLGSSFPADALVAISPQPEAAVRAGLEELLHREVLSVSADRLSPQIGDFRFAQELLRQVAYDTLSRRDLKARHLAVAGHLRSVFPNDGEEVAEAVAQHYLDAAAAVPNDPDAASIRAEAVPMLVRAAERALRAGSPAAAAARYAGAAVQVEALGDGGESGSMPAARLWELAADAGIDAAETSDAIGHAERARALYDEAGDARGVARARSQLGRGLRYVGRHADAREHLVAACEVLRPDPDADTVAALVELGLLEVFSGTGKGEDLCAEALELAQAVEVDTPLLAECFIARGVAHGRADRHAESASHLEYAAALAARGGAGGVRARALLNLADVLNPTDPAAAIEAARAGVDESRRVGLRNMLPYSVANLVEALLLCGRWDEADEVLAEASEEYGLADDELLAAFAALLAALRGDDLAGAGALLGLHATEAPQEQTMAVLVDAFVAAARGDLDRTLALAREVLAQVGALGIRHEVIIWSWPLAVRTAGQLGDDGFADEALHVLDAHPGGHLPPLLRAERLLLAANRGARGGASAAGPAFDDAVAALRRHGSAYHLAHGLLDHATHLVATRDHERAAVLVDEAETIAERLRARPLRTRVEAVRGSLTRAAPPPPEPVGVS
jgi:hypothetical protein